MLKLNASYSKKVPAEGEYTSQSYHASVEVELPDGLSQEQLQNRIHETFEMVRNSVEAELHGNIPNQQGVMLRRIPQISHFRTILLQVPNRSIICFLWQANGESLRRRSLPSTMWQVSIV